MKVEFQTVNIFLPNSCSKTSWVYVCVGAEAVEVLGSPPADKDDKPNCPKAYDDSIKYLHL